jgi:hypothetical protein
MKKRLRRFLNTLGYDFHGCDRHELLSDPERKFKGPLTIPGWFSARECQKLYALILETKGPILEIGHFLGRTTACIAHALRDSGMKRLFNSYDLAFRSATEFKAYYDALHKRDVPVPHFYEKHVFSKGLTTTAVAKEKLDALELTSYVTLISGDYSLLDTYRYDFIFSDAVHDEPEIQRNLPQIVKRSNPGAIWAFHDTKDATIDLITSMAPVVFIESVGTLGVYLYKG